MLSALGGVGMGVAELGRPGEVEEVVVEVLLAGGCGDGAWLFVVALLADFGGWCGLLWIAAEKRDEEKEGCGDCFASRVHWCPSFAARSSSTLIVWLAADVGLRRMAAKRCWGSGEIERCRRANLG